MSEVESDGVFWKIFPYFSVVCTFLFTTQERQFDTGFCNQPGPAGFLTHSAQKANPFQSTYCRFSSRLSEMQPGNCAQTKYKRLLC